MYGSEQQFIDSRSGANLLLFAVQQRYWEGAFRNLSWVCEGILFLEWICEPVSKNAAIPV